MRARPKALTALLLATALLTGCSGSDSGGSGDSAESAAAPAVADGNAAGTGGEAGTGGDGADASLQVGNLRAAPGAALIRTADLDVRVDDVRKAADEAGRIARAAGGAVEAEDRSAGSGGGSATVQLRVPPKAFDVTLAELSGLGDERSRRTGSEDVTDQVVDLEARLATQRASVERVRALLGEADALGEVVQIESELTKRTADLEALEARLAALSARVDLSTIVVRFDSEGGPVVGEALGFGDGIEAGWSALSTVGRILAVSTGALLPFLPLLLMAAWFGWRAHTRRSRALPT